MIFSSLCYLAAAVKLAGATYIGKDFDNDDSDDVSYSNFTLTENRPLVHFTPQKGWMNDPNGLWYDAKEELYHMYFQYNPEDNIWGSPLYWGHAVSDDLTTWEERGIALGPKTNDSAAFSGSAVVDVDNTSGFFNDTTDPRQRVVAIWTHNAPDKQSQYVSYSVDGGDTFIEYENNPVLDLNSTQFRDPKVIWHEETKKWIMIVAMSQKYEIAIYSSDDLVDWTYESAFGNAGYLGFQYECPGLVKVPVVQTEQGGLTVSNLTYPNTTSYNSTYFNATNTSTVNNEAWVMFLSINPGGPLGGSATQYFIGDFNGTHFEPFTTQARFLDLGKDYYAVQTFYNSPNADEVLGIAWASNWQYAQNVPTYEWRSSMSLARNFTLREYSPNPESVQLNLNSEPVLNANPVEAQNATFSFEDELLLIDNELSGNFPSNISATAIEFEIEWSVNEIAFNITELNGFVLSLATDDYDEFLTFGYEANAQSFFFNRGNTEEPFVYANPFFNEKLSVYLEPYSTSSNGTNTYKVHGIVDQNIAELYFNDGSVVSTNLFFTTPGNQLTWWSVDTSIDGGFKLDNFTISVLDV